MNKEKALKELDKIYPYTDGMGRAEEYAKYEKLIKRFEWNERDLDWLIKNIKEMTQK